MLGVTLMFSPEEITEVSKLDGVRGKIENFQAEHLKAVNYRSLDAPFIKANHEALAHRLPKGLSFTATYDGQVFGVLLVAYPIVRSIIELARLDLERGFLLPDLLGETISTSQAVSVPVVALGVLLLLRARRAAAADGTLGLDPRGAAETRMRRRIEAALATA